MQSIRQFYDLRNNSIEMAFNVGCPIQEPGPLHSWTYVDLPSNSDDRAWARSETGIDRPVAPNPRPKQLGAW